MSKDIVIKENGVSRNVTSARISTTGNNSMDTWLPEDETVLEELSVTQNGEYEPSGYGYSEVTVDVEGGGGSEGSYIEKTITENGLYNAADDNVSGYSKVIVDVPESETYIYFAQKPVLNYISEDDRLDYSNAIVKAVYPDGTEKDVTSECTFDPPANTPLSQFRNVDEIPITVTWRE